MPRYVVTDSNSLLRGFSNLDFLHWKVRRNVLDRPEIVKYLVPTKRRGIETSTTDVTFSPLPPADKYPLNAPSPRENCCGGRGGRATNK